MSSIVKLFGPQELSLNLDNVRTETSHQVMTVPVLTAIRVVQALTVKVFMDQRIYCFINRNAIFILLTSLTCQSRFLNNQLLASLDV